METTAKPEPVEAFLANNRVSVPLSDMPAELRERGFGTLRGKRIYFSVLEAIYLADKKRTKVLDSTTEIEIKFADMVRKLSQGKPEVWMKYLVYRDLRDRGYIVREEESVDFEIYGKGAVRRLVSIIYEGREASIEKLQGLLKVAVSEKKELVLAVIDRRTDIVYYTLGELSLK
jgi:tRNA-intron endonuclease